MNVADYKRFQTKEWRAGFHSMSSSLNTAATLAKTSTKPFCPHCFAIAWRKVIKHYNGCRGFSTDFSRGQLAALQEILGGVHEDSYCARASSSPTFTRNIPRVSTI